MFTTADSAFVGSCLEGFLFGIYSGIFAMYLQCPSIVSRKAIIVFYLLCLLYVLSMATVVCDLLTFILQEQVLYNLNSTGLSFGVSTVQVIANGCCDFIAQCVLIYRCWIVWGKDIRVVIIPSILSITYVATSLAGLGAYTFEKGQHISAFRATINLTLTSLAASMAVNTLATSLIVFKILKVLLEYTSTSAERTSGSTWDTKLWYILFIIIESGMMLFAIQLVSIVLFSLVDAASVTVETASEQVLNILCGLDIVISMRQMLNGIAPTVILVRVSMKFSFDDEESFKEAAGSLHFNKPPSDPNALALQEVGSSSMERNGDICSNNSPSHLNSLGGAGSSSSMPPQ